MLINLDTRDRKLIVNCLRFGLADSLNSVRGSGQTEVEKEEEDAEIARLEQMYGNVIKKFQEGRQKKTPEPSPPQGA